MKIRFAVLLAGVVFLALFGGLNYYIGLRGWQSMGSAVPYLGSRLYWAVFWLISMSYILARLLKTRLPEMVGRIMELAGAYWLAIMFYLLFVILMIDLIRFVDKRFGFLPQSFTQNRRVMLMVSLAVVLMVAALMVYGTWNSRSVKIASYPVEINKPFHGNKQIRIAMISDLHLGDIVDKKRLEGMVGSINRLKPDIVLIPGDIVDDTTDSFVRQKMGESFRKIISRYGVYASLGNHDGMLQNADVTADVLKKAGITVLRDQSVLVADSFYLVGRDDDTVNRGTGKKRKPLLELLGDIDMSKPVILLDHQPVGIAEAERLGVDMQVSGHTHKGQIFPSNLITSRIYEIDYGYLKKGDFHIVVSAGIGTWGPPVRIGSRAEIAEITLKSVQEPMK